jgi:hypothetical protein
MFARSMAEFLSPSDSIAHRVHSDKLNPVQTDSGTSPKLGE